jgi:hypothetical protein
LRERCDNWLSTHATSAKTGEGVQELFREIAQAVCVRAATALVPPRAKIVEKAPEGGCC